MRKLHIINYSQLIVIFLCVKICNAQNGYPQNYFRSPLDIPLKLSGNFGELRSGHFHSGLDFKTDSTEGKPVYVSADGYVSRIKISSVGFGKVLYVNHPDGYTSVYAHLKCFNDSITAFTESEQYRKENFEIELFPDSNRFRLKKGDLIALSGNTGGSEGPHLHFEIRNTKTEKPINPLLFGFEIKDIISPALLSVLIYDHKIPKLVLLKTNEPGHFISDTITVNSFSGLGFEGFDLCGEEKNELGIYEVRLKVDSVLLSQYTFNTFAFDETRYVNAHIDYEIKSDERKTVERCYRLPGDHFSGYNVMFTEDSIEKIFGKGVHRAHLEIEDVSGNETQADVVFRVLKKNMVRKGTQIKCSPVHYNKRKLFKTPEVILDIPANTFYDDFCFEYDKEIKKKGLYSNIHHVHHPAIPFNSYATLSIKTKGLPASLEEKSLIVSVDKKGRTISEGGSYKNGFVTTKIRSFGNYAIAIDTVAPLPEFISFTDTVSVGDTVKIKVTDNLSGLDSYRATLNGKWLLTEYDPRIGLLYFRVPVWVNKSGNEFAMEAIDKKKNKTILQKSFWVR